MDEWDKTMRSEHPHFDDVVDLWNAIADEQIRPEELTGFICKSELFIRMGKPEDVFTAYYGTTRACEDICALLGIEDIQHV